MENIKKKLACDWIDVKFGIFVQTVLRTELNCKRERHLKATLGGSHTKGSLGAPDHLNLPFEESIVTLLFSFSTSFKSE